MQRAVLTLNHVNDLAQLPGEIVPDNPVKFNAYMALMHAHGNPVRIIISNDPAVADEPILPPIHWLEPPPPLRGLRTVALDYVPGQPPRAGRTIHMDTDAVEELRGLQDEQRYEVEVEPAGLEDDNNFLFDFDIQIPSGYNGPAPGHVILELPL